MKLLFLIFKKPEHNSDSAMAYINHLMLTIHKYVDLPGYIKIRVAPSGVVKLYPKRKRFRIMSGVVGIYGRTENQMAIE